MAIVRSIMQVASEYGIVLERFTPKIIDGILFKIENVYIPRI